MIWLLLYTIPCIWFAKINADWTAKVDWTKGKRIKHFYNGLLHCAAAIGAWFIFRNWQAPLIILLLARLVFDTLYAVFMGHSIDYTTPTPRSLVDKLEQKVFGRNGVLPKIIYAFIIVILFVI